MKLPGYLGSWNDVSYYDEDLQCLNNGVWYTATPISFWGEHLKAIEEDMANQANNTVKIKFCCPLVFFCCVGAEDLEEFSEIADENEWGEADYIFFPINSEEDFGNVGGGMHWALAIWAKQKRVFYWVDSTSNKELPNLHKFGKWFREYLKIENYNVYYNLPSEKQNNSYDCGAFVSFHMMFYLWIIKNGLFLENCSEDKYNKKIQIIEKTQDNLVILLSNQNKNLQSIGTYIRYIMHQAFLYRLEKKNNYQDEYKIFLQINNL